MSTGKYEIREAQQSDVPLLPSIERKAATLFASRASDLGFGTKVPVEVNSVETFQIAQEAGHLWVAVDSRDEPVGFALVLEVDGFAHLEELDVLPEHGRKGLGSQLVETVCSWAKKNGYPAVTLSTFRDVPWNGPFYMSRGFRVLEASELTSGLAQLVEREQRWGLRTDLREIMRRDM